MFAVRGGRGGGGGGKNVDDEDSKWEVTNTYITSITQTQIDSFNENLVNKANFLLFCSCTFGIRTHNLN